MLQVDALHGGVVRGRKNPLHYGLPLRLKRARQAAGVTHRALAERAGISLGVVGHVEAGRAGDRAPGVDTIERIARGLGVSPCWLAYGEEGPLPFQLKRPRVEAAKSGLEDLYFMGLLKDVDFSALEGSPPPLLCQGLPLRLRATREARGLSRKALGRAAGISLTSISNIEDKGSLPNVASAEQLATALDVAPCWLAYGQGRAAP